MRDALVDTAVLVYAFGSDHPLRSHARSVLDLVSSGQVRLHASVELVQEFLHHRMRRIDRGEAVLEANQVRELCVIHPFDIEVLDRAQELISQVPSIGGRDAVHAATALVHGISAIISPDRGYDGVPGLRRVAMEEVVSG